jgi:DNA gyrase/topoisomerase IV subunit B
LLVQVQYNPGLVKVFDEILVNAVDNAVRDASQTRIDVTIDSAADGAPTLSVFNDGRGIPIRKHATEGASTLLLRVGLLGRQCARVSSPPQTATSLSL